MRSPSSRLFFLLAVAAVVKGQEMPGCGATCLTGVTQQGDTLGCPGGALPCLCANQRFFFGIRDCAANICAPDLLPIVESYAKNLCASATAAVAPTDSVATVPSAPATPTTLVPVPTTAASPTSATVPTPAVPTTAATTPSSSPTAASSSIQPSSAISTKSTTAGAADSTAGAKETTSSSAAPSGGMSNGVKIGVGIGAAAGGIALIALVACILITRRHKNKSDPNGGFQISEPLPGSGRSYANDHHHKQYRASKTELESNARRYEDMVPRQKPRTMV